MAEANARIARVDAWLIPGLGRTIAITNASGTDWPADTYAHFGPLSESTGEVVPTIAAVTATVVGPVATVTLTEADVETIREAFPHTGFARCPWHIRTGSGAGEVAHATGFLGWDLTGSAQSATAVATVIVGPQGPTAVSADIGNAAELGTDGLLFVSPTAGSAHVIRDEGTPLTNRAALNFAGAGVTVTDDAGNGATLVTIPSGGATTLDALTDVATAGQSTGKALVFDGSGWVPSSAATVLNGDSRLTDARTPTAHAHAQSDVTGLATSLAGKSDTGHTHAASDVSSGTLNIARIPTGTTGTTVPFGNDSRFTDARTPTDGSVTNVKVPAGAAIDLDKTADSATRLALTAGERTKLSNTSGTNTGDQTLPTWSTIAGKPAVVGAGATQADARTAIGAGTSSLVIGTAAGTAAEGNDARLSDARTPTAHTHPATGISDSTAVGRSVVTATDAAAARTAIGAGTLSTETLAVTIVDAKGDLIVGTAADTASRLAVGATTGHVLTVNPATATGLEWAAGVGGIGVGAFTFGYAGGDDQTLLAGNYLRSGTGTITIPTTVGHLFPMPMAHSVTVDGFRLKLATAGDGSCQLQVALYAITAAGVLGARLSPVWTVGATTTGEKYTTALTPFSVPAGMSVIVVTSSGQVSTNPQLASSGNPSPLAWSWANGEGAAGRWAACSSVTSLPDPWTAGAATSIGSSETPILGLFF